MNRIYFNENREFHDDSYMYPEGHSDDEYDYGIAEEKEDYSDEDYNEDYNEENVKEERITIHNILNNIGFNNFLQLNLNNNNLTLCDTVHIRNIRENLLNIFPKNQVDQVDYIFIKMIYVNNIITDINTISILIREEILISFVEKSKYNRDNKEIDDIVTKIGNITFQCKSDIMSQNNVNNILVMINNLKIN